MSIVKGSCLCGQVHYQITGNLGVFQNCHCSRCRKVSGAMHSSNLFVTKSDFVWTQGEGELGRFEPEDAKYFATSFCKCCGSTMPWLSRNDRTMIIPAGTLDDDPEIRPGGNVYYASKAAWHTVAGELPTFNVLPPRT